LAAVIGVPPWHKDLVPLNIGLSSFAMADHQGKAASNFVAAGARGAGPTLKIEGRSDPSHTVILHDHDRWTAWAAADRCSKKNGAFVEISTKPAPGWHGCRSMIFRPISSTAEQEALADAGQP
jgi:hypothetical protein